MGIKDVFKSDPAKKLRADLESRLRARTRDRDDTAEELRTVEAKIAERVEAARALVADGGFADAKLGTIKAEKREKEDRAASLRGGLARIDSDIAELQREIAEDIDREQRVATAATIDAWVDEWSRAAAAFDSACRLVESISSLTVSVAPEAGGTKNFALDARQQLPAAVALITTLLKNHRAGVLAGGSKATLAKPAQPVQLKLVEAPKVTEVVALRAVKYFSADNGAMVCVGTFQRHFLPDALVDQAMRAGAVCAVGDPRVRGGQIGSLGMVLPHESRCELLGDAPTAKAAPKSTVAPITHSAFEVVDRGPAYNITVPRGPEPVPMPRAVSARMQPDDDEG
jgi:hypothetical protein